MNEETHLSLMFETETETKKEYRSSYDAAIEDMLARCGETLKRKHAEYANENDFHNFDTAAALQGITREQALIGMMDKHVVSVHDMVNQKAEGREIPLDRWAEKITDNICYLLILWSMLSELREKQ